MRVALPVVIAALSLLVAVQLAVDGAVGRFAYASESAYQALVVAREGGTVVAGWLWPLLLRPLPMEAVPGVLAILGMLGAVIWLARTLPTAGGLAVLAAAALPLQPLRGDETALACLAALWLVRGGGAPAGLVAAALRWELAFLVRSREAFAGASLGLLVHGVLLKGNLHLLVSSPDAERLLGAAVVALVGLACVIEGRATGPRVVAGAVLCGVSPLPVAPLLLALVGPAEQARAKPVAWLPAAVLGLFGQLGLPAAASQHELVEGHVARLAQHEPVTSPSHLVHFRAPSATLGTALPERGLLALPPGLEPPQAGILLGSWSLHEQAVMHFWTEASGLVGAQTAFSDFAADLREVVVGTAQPVTPGGDEALLDSCGPQVVFDLSGGTLLNAVGRLQDPMLVNGKSRVEVDVALPGGSYVLSLRASTTTVDGEVGRVQARLGASLLGTFEIPEGPATEHRLSFTVAQPTRAPLWLQFTNDSYSEEQDRNVVLSTLVLTRSAGEAPERRAARLRRVLEGHDLLLVSIDTLRADHVSAYGYRRATSPVLDGLAASGVLASNAIASSHWTGPSHASLLTGLHPPEHGVEAFPEPDALGAVPTLAGVLRDAGYHTMAVTGGGYVAHSTGLDQGFEHFEEGVEDAAMGFERAAERWLEAPEQPRFLFVHTYQVHDPYDPPAPYDRWFAPDLPDDPRLRGDLRDTYLSGWRPSPAELEGMIALYDGEIRYTDARLQVLLDAVARSGRAERTLIVVTSDHGEEFFEHGGMSHARLNGEVLRVPLIFSHPLLPGLADPVVDEVIAGVDVMPTVLDLLGVDAPPMSGVSRVQTLTGGCDAQTAWGSSQMIREHRYSLLEADWHYIEDGDRQLLYDLQTDVRERADVAGEHLELLQTFAERTRAWREARQLAAPTRRVERTEEELEGLRALGYIE